MKKDKQLNIRVSQDDLDHLDCLKNYYELRIKSDFSISSIIRMLITRDFRVINENEKLKEGK